jgi:hypothetical protein
MSFETSLDTAHRLAGEYTALDASIKAMAVAEDHDPSWSEADTAELDQREARAAALVRLLAAALGQLARDHGNEWEQYLAASVDRLETLFRNVEKKWVCEYERDRWRDWTRGALAVSDQPEIFARGVAVLNQYRDEIDRLVAGGR